MHLFRLFVISALWPAMAAAVSLPQVADFSHSRWDLLAPAYQAQSAITYWSSDADGAYLSLQAGRLRLPLADGGDRVGGPVLDLDTLPYSRSLVLAWSAPSIGARLTVCLIDESGQPLCAELQAKRAGWQESSVAFPGALGDAIFNAAPGRALKAGAIELEAADAGTVIGLRELRLDPPAETVRAETVAAAFGGSPAQVRALRHLGLPETLVWVLQRVLQACGCSASDLARERATKSWGEIAQGHGLDWKALIADVEQRRDAAGLPAVPPSPWQEQRSFVNADLNEVQP